MNFPQLIKEKRLSLGESQLVFAKRFQRGRAVVYKWENGEVEAPYEVLTFVLEGQL